MRISAINSINYPNGINVRKRAENRPQPCYAQAPVNFGMRIDYGIPAKLAEPLQKKVLNIHQNIDLIQNFFTKYNNNNPQLGAKIKKDYADLIPKRQSGIVFKLPDSDKTIEVMKSQTRDNILYISIEDGSQEFNGIVVDGQDKLIANYLKRHPHMLPRGIKHMNAERMTEAEPEKFINLADEKIQAYSDYIRKLQSGEIPMPKLSNSSTPKTGAEKKATKKVVKSAEKPAETEPKQEKPTKVVDRVSIPKHRLTGKPKKLTNAEFEEYMAKKSKDVVSKITRLLNGEIKEVPEHLEMKLAPSGKPLGFTLKTDDGGTLKVMRKAVGSYGNSMPYLSFEKNNPDNSMNFISIDMVSNKVLKTKDRGKPHISSDHIVFDMSADEMKRRKIEDKLDNYMGQIFKETPKEAPKEAPSIKEKTIEKVTEQKPEPITQPDDMEKLKQSMRELGKKNGSIAATEYFNAFKEQFMADLQQKMAEFQSSVKNFMDTLSK